MTQKSLRGNEDSEKQGNLQICYAGLDEEWTVMERCDRAKRVITWRECRQVILLCVLVSSEIRMLLSSEYVDITHTRIQLSTSGESQEILPGTDDLPLREGQNKGR